MHRYGADGVRQHRPVYGGIGDGWGARLLDGDGYSTDWYGEGDSSVSPKYFYQDSQRDRDYPNEL